ncbi:GmrSD restriction endonuclease domain-containing protein [Georgenia faecalis]|uniref:GmrSD restriction endonuclease domain-containing protein n=1 Tax=Georgenia faecalis TaxID=2483799 RepID=UPI000FDCC193|nr:DUF1524 domain-containing protein [Georgenia faecalis]
MPDDQPSRIRAARFTAPGDGRTTARGGGRTTAPGGDGRSILRRGATLLAAGVLALGLAGCGAVVPSTDGGAAAGPTGVAATASGQPAPTVASTGAPTGEPGLPAAGTALDAAQELEVKGRAPQTGYDRDLFGSGWVDVDRNGCDTRNDILSRDLTEETFRPGTRDCVVLTGVLADPYSGTTIAFVRGNDTSTAVQIDHVVALSDAWQKGAQQWDEDTRVRFANDPLNLLAVDGSLNMSKGDGDTATWLPPNRAYRCAYVARQVGVKDTYGLWVTQAEQDAMVRLLSTCPDEPLPAGDAAAPAPAPAPTPAAPGPAPAPPAPAPAPPALAPAPPASGTVPYENCSAARAAGAAPVRVGDPGYGTHLDGDGDGVACE